MPAQEKSGNSSGHGLSCINDTSTLGNGYCVNTGLCCGQWQAVARLSARRRKWRIKDGLLLGDEQEEARSQADGAGQVAIHNGIG